jgi:hypothetical protein
VEEVEVDKEEATDDQDVKAEEDAVAAEAQDEEADKAADEMAQQELTGPQHAAGMLLDAR